MSSSKWICFWVIMPPDEQFYCQFKHKFVKDGYFSCYGRNKIEAEQDAKYFLFKSGFFKKERDLYYFVIKENFFSKLLIKISN